MKDVSFEIRMRLNRFDWIYVFWSNNDTTKSIIIFSNNDHGKDHAILSHKTKDFSMTKEKIINIFCFGWNMQSQRECEF